MWFKVKRGRMAWASEMPFETAKQQVKAYITKRDGINLME
jgi:hypothetical protein